MLDRNSAVERVRFEVVTTMPGGERPVGFLGGGIVGSAGVELVDVIRRVVGEPKGGGGTEGRRGSGIFERPRSSASS